MTSTTPDDDRWLLIVEDDEAFARTLARSFERRGYRVLHADSLPRVEEVLAAHTPRYAVVDLWEVILRLIFLWRLCKRIQS